MEVKGRMNGARFVAFLRALNSTCSSATARDEPWGMREFGVRTIDGHRMMFGQEMVRPR